MSLRLAAVLLTMTTVSMPGLFDRFRSPRRARPPANCCPPQESASDPIPAAVQIVSHTGRMKFLGSGVLIPGNQILTAAHTFANATSSIDVIFLGGVKVKARLVRKDASLDLALLSIPESARRPCRIADAPPVVGDQITASGYGDAREPFRTFRGGLRSFASNTLTLPGCARGGDSGGPILDRDGCLIGILTHTGSGIILGVRWQRIREFLGLRPDEEKENPDAESEEPQPEVIESEEPPADDQRLAALEARLDALAELVAAIPECPECPPLDVDALVELLVGNGETVGLLPGITFQPIDSAGRPVEEPATRRLGETIKMHSFLVKKPD